MSARVVVFSAKMIGPEYVIRRLTICPAHHRRKSGQNSQFHVLSMVSMTAQCIILDHSAEICPKLQGEKLMAVVLAILILCIMKTALLRHFVLPNFKKTMPVPLISPLPVPPAV